MVGDIAQIGFDLFQVGDIRKQHVGVDHIFVDRVEIVEQHLAPKVEFIELLVCVELTIDVIKFGDQSYSLAVLDARNGGHQLVDGYELRLPHRSVGKSAQSVGKEELRTMAGKQNPKPRHITPIPRIEIRSHLLDESNHLIF